MIRGPFDKVAVRVPALTDPSPRIERLYTELRRGFEVWGFRRSRFYTLVGDLRPQGVPAILHWGLRFGGTPDHKLELLDTGERTFTQLMQDILAVFDVDPLALEIMRLDIAVDVPGVPVPWFQKHARVVRKVWVSDLGEVPLSEMGKRTIQTLYFGKRPNMFRIYDKVAEYEQQYRTYLRQVFRQKPAARMRVVPTRVLSFEEFLGYAPEPTLTRIERQMSGDRVPQQLSTVRHLLRASEFDPFYALRLRPSTDKAPELGEDDFSEWLAGTRLRQLLDEMGEQRLRHLINKHSRGNANRYFEGYAKYLSADGVSFTNEDLDALYKKSLAKQLDWWPEALGKTVPLEVLTMPTPHAYDAPP